MTSVKLDNPSTPGLSSPGRRWTVAAGVLAVVGVVLVGLTFVVKGVSEDLAGWSYTIGFLVLFAAIVAVLVGRIRDRREGLALLPVTGLGWVALGATVLAVVFVFTDLVMLGFWVFLAGAIAAVAGVLLGRERSVPAFVLPLVGAVFALAFVFGELVIGHA